MQCIYGSGRKDFSVSKFFNSALNLALFGRRTLRDKAAQQLHVRR